jgi:hypothetical protein
MTTIQHAGVTENSKSQLLVLQIFLKSNKWRSRNDILQELLADGHMICSVVPISDLEHPKNGFVFEKRILGGTKYKQYRLSERAKKKARKLSVGKLLKKAK